MITIVIPVKNPKFIDEFIDGNIDVLTNFPVIVVDSGGGEKLGKIAKVHIQKDVKLCEARKIGYGIVETEFIMNLDADVIIPKLYIQEALKALSIADAVSIFYEDVNHCQGALEFGCSIWRTDVLRKLYDFSFEIVVSGKIVKVGSHKFSTLHNGWCECTYMWRKLKENGFNLETLPFRAKHLKVNKIDN